MTDTTNEAAAAAEEASRGKGRPTIAELTAREQAISDREKTIDEKMAELEAAQANLQALLEQVNGAGRSAPVRAAPLRSGTITEPVRGRRYKGGEMPNEFHIPAEDIPDGISYQWNNHTVFGQENPSYSSHMQMQGWVPVPASRHPHLVPAGYDLNGSIIVKGQILVERPMELTQEALQEELDKARGEVRMKEEQLYGPQPEGQFQRARANGTNEFNQINREVVRGGPSPANYQYEAATGPVIE
jgi:hypothetical protein